MIRAPPTSSFKSTHGTLVSLLHDSLNVSPNEQSLTILDDNNKPMLLKRVTVLYNQLVELGFEETCARRVLIQTRAVSLEQALDWACLHISTQELPAFLTDRDAVVDSMLTTLQDPHRLTVVAAAARKTNKEGAERNASGLKLESNMIHPKAMSKSAPKQEDDDKAAQKAWLLAQYEYEQDDEEYNSDEEQEKSSPMTPLERQLYELQQEYNEIDGILQDEAQQYMMSKHDIKEARKKRKVLKKQLEGFKRRAQQERATHKTAATAEMAADNDDDDAGMTLDIFQVRGGGEDDGDHGSSMSSKLDEARTEDATKGIASDNAPTIVDYSIPTNWTGKTPKQVLEERCKKLKIAKPQYNKRGNGGKIQVKCKPTFVVIEEEGPFTTFTEAQNYLATKALYEMDSSLPLYRLLPPVFRDLWVSWLDAAKQKRLDEQQAISHIKEQKMMDIVESILSQHAEKTTNGTATAQIMSDAKGDGQKVNETRDDDVPDTWDDSDAYEESVKDGQCNQVSAEGAKLQAVFLKRQKTPHYQSMLEVRKSLPMYSYRQQFLDTIQDNQVTVLCAETGAGKTTQCGQFLIEAAFSTGIGDKISILCTQPRRVSAISVAERVSDEFGDSNVGDTIGYHIRLESKRTSRTKLLFCTTGVVLRRLQDDPTLEGITHVLVDEVHERQWQIDFLLIALRGLIHTTRKDLNIVLVRICWLK